MSVCVFVVCVYLCMYACVCSCVCLYMLCVRTHLCISMHSLHDLKHSSGETVEVLLKNMFDADNATDNVILCGISYLIMLVDTKRYSMQCVCAQVFIYPNRAVNMYYGGFGSLSYSTSEEPSNIDLEASECQLCC